MPLQLKANITFRRLAKVGGKGKEIYTGLLLTVADEKVQMVYKKHIFDLFEEALCFSSTEVTQTSMVPLRSACHITTTMYK